MKIICKSSFVWAQKQSSDAPEQSEDRRGCLQINNIETKDFLENIVIILKDLWNKIEDNRIHRI